MNSGEFEYLTPDENLENPRDVEELSDEELAELGELLGYVGLTSHEMDEDPPEMNAIVILTPGVEFLAGLLTDKNACLEDLYYMRERDAEHFLTRSSSGLINRKQVP